MDHDEGRSDKVMLLVAVPPEAVVAHTTRAYSVDNVDDAGTRENYKDRRRGC